jgi:membrane-anchored glycerophosphoryl diester phosphodiesterase (GDPDase)
MGFAIRHRPPGLSEYTLSGLLLPDFTAGFTAKLYYRFLSLALLLVFIADLQTFFNLPDVTHDY